jgi:uncharacterized protein (DUF1697 family)
MSVHIALLRSVNVTGHNKIAMADLRAWLTGQGLENVRTLLQTGNAVFETSGGSEADLERRLEAQAREQLGLDTAFFVRTPEEWQEAMQANPFAAEAERDPARTVVLALKEEAVPARVEALRAGIKGPERIETAGRALYAVYPDGQGRSKLTTALIERALETRCTARNWNTVLRIAEAVR